ncbi:MAG: winged helix-turn-helix transcriptional regulator [Chloroflexi bacterium]|nr:winged helix-turn-helix transcriptional regulator [Chloroflexota bacterium]
MPSSNPETVSEALVFEALADATRRRVLELLRTCDTMTAGEIAAAFPGISRPAVSRHLRILRDAGLVRARESGREWHYRLDPGPLRAMQDEWLSTFAPIGQTSLRRLKQRAESETKERRGTRRETPASQRKRIARR